jgi:predicted DCC family thiol-disulfide oxidoreductase YuxK
VADRFRERTVSVLTRIERYWFAPARLRDLAYVRASVVLVLLLGVLWPGSLESQLQLTRLPAEWFMPLPALKVLLLPLGWGARPSALVVTISWVVCVAAGLAALVGAHTRATLATFAVTCTFLVMHQYAFGTLHHPEAAATIMVWVLIVTPCGAELSVDAMRSRVAESRARGQFEARWVDAWSWEARWPMRLAQWLLVCVYASAGLTKLVVAGSAWMNGYTMTYYLLLDGISHQLPVSVALAHVHWFGVACAAAAMAFELTFVLCVLFPRLSAGYLAVGTALHTGIWLFMRPPFFQFIALYAAFAEPLRTTWRRWARPRDEGAERRVWTLVYDGYCPLCIRTMTQLDELDGARRLRYVDLERESARARALLPGVSIEDMREEMAVVTPSGEGLRGFFAFREISRRLPVLWPLVPAMFAPGSAWLGTRVYAWVAANRARRLCEGDACSVHGAHGAGNGTNEAGAVIDFGGSAS